jgi:hypothetical protein
MGRDRQSDDPGACGVKLSRDEGDEGDKEREKKIAKINADERR